MFNVGAVTKVLIIVPVPEPTLEYDSPLSVLANQIL